MGAQSTTLSSVGTSTPIILNPVLKTTTIQVSATTVSSIANVAVQFTLDDPTATPAPTVTWANLSSAIVTSSAGVGMEAGLIYTVLSPLGGLRLNSTAISGTFTLKAIQSVTG